MKAAKANDERLRWGGLKCLGLMLQYDEEWTQGVQQQYGEPLLLLLSEASATDPCVRCRRQALLALAAFLSALAPEEGSDPAPSTLALVRLADGGVASTTWELKTKVYGLDGPVATFKF